jgi:hypothetical protein
VNPRRDQPDPTRWTNTTRRESPNQSHQTN